jgi:hypothetical protein
LATFKKISKADMSTYKVTLVPMLRDDKTIAGRVTAIVIGDCGSLDVRSTVPDDPAISEAFAQASGFAGADGIVGVYDPDNLWAPEWPPLA